MASGWSPAYDLNPTPIEIKPRRLSTTIDYDNNDASLELALRVSLHFGLKKENALEIIRTIGKVVSTWRQEAKRLQISSREIDFMSSAFEHKDLQYAVSI